MGELFDVASWVCRACDEPFWHVVIDDFVRPERAQALAAAFDDEPAEEIHDEIFSVMASAPELASAELRAYAIELASPEVIDAVSALAGARLSRCEVRAYVYLAGHYLLPHADHQAALGRGVALAHYVDARELEGGELELFACDVEGDSIDPGRARVRDSILATRPDLRIEPRRSRAVLFEVSPRSLHQVREVTRGARLSLAGWFYP